jgi:GntR family transcriptional repressor for pyruvate dehydrogenase complex
MITTLSKQNIVDEVFRQIFDSIMRGQWEEGQKLPSENDLKDLFGVSRNTIRSAISRLGVLGLVETKQGEGNFVRKIGVGLYMNSLIPYIFLNHGDIFTIMEFRRGFEIQAAQLAARKATESDIHEIKTALDICHEESCDLDNYMYRDMAFHLAIAKATKNELIYETMSIIKNYCYKELQNFVTPLIRDKSCEYHQLIFECIEAHDEQKANLYMTSHLDDVYTQIKNNHVIG